MRQTGIEAIGEVPWGTHFCQFYQAKQDLIDVLVPYFKAGLERNEFCMWVTSDPLGAEEAKAALAAAVGNLETYLRRGQLEVLDYTQWYTAGGGFDSGRVLSGWVRKHDEALKRGFDGLRLTGNTFWLEEGDWKSFTDYEAAVDAALRRYRMLALCTYSLDKCGAAEVSDVVANHQFAVIKRGGQWEIIQSAERAKAAAALEESERRYRRGNERLSILSDSAAQMLRSENPQQAVESLCRRVMEFLDCQAFFNFLVDEEAGKLRLNACAGIPPEDARRIEWLDYGAAVCGCAARDACRIVAEDIAHTPDPRTELVKSYGIQAYACHPLKVRERVLGTLSFGARTRTKFSEEDLSLMSAVADHVAIAMDRVRASEALRKANTELEDRVARRTEELGVSSRYARNLLEASIDPLVTISPEGKITDVNRATEEATGVERRSLIGSDFCDYFTEPEKARAGYQQVIREGLVRDYPLTIRHASGRTTPVLYNATVYRDEAGQVQGVFAAARDITVRKRMENELRATSLYARSLIEASLDPLVTISPEGKITDVNEATEQATGMPRAKLVGTDFSLYFTEPRKANEGYRRVLAEGYVRDYPLTIRHISGRKTEVLYNATVYRDEAGGMQGVFAAARDVTEHNAAQRRQAATHSLLELFAHATARKEYLDSAVAVIRDWSGCRCVGIRILDEAKNLPYESSVGFDEEFLRVENRLQVGRDLCFCTRAVTQEPLDTDRPLQTPGGAYRCEDALSFVKDLTIEQAAGYRGHCMRRGFASLALVPIRYLDKVVGVIHLADPRKGVVTDGTVAFIESMAPLIGEAVHRFNTEAELAHHRDHLEELVRQRTAELHRTAEDLRRSNRDLEQFAYVASHDLQEPLRAVGGFVGLLRRQYEGRLDEKANEYIGMAVDGAERMQTMIHDLLAFSRVGSKGSPLEKTSARAALEEALANLRQSIQESQAAVTHEELPTVQADATQLVQLFGNLIGNAIKFRSERAPAVHVGAARREGDWLFRVQDNGIGIDPQYQERIFLLFQRLHTRQAYPGTGIGLAVCKRIVERHGGRIWVESQPGKGSTFFFTIPDRGEDT